MRNDDVIKSIRHTLDISDGTVADIIRLGGYRPSRDEVALIFADEPEEGEKRDVSDKLMAHFLDGLIYHRRGKSDKHPPRPIELPVTNNQVLKKLRVAFKLREEEIEKMLKEAGFTIAASELNALFRDKKHRNYRPCGDQVMRYFLKGLFLRFSEKES